MDKNTKHSKELNNKAYLGKLAQDLLLLSSNQVMEVYAQRGIDIPVEVSSTLNHLYNNDNVALANVAMALDIPHQLASQRIKKLLKLNLVKKQGDPNDMRRSVLTLTEKGQQQAILLIECMNDMAIIYDAVYQEIGCDLPEVLNSAINALKGKSLINRFNETFNQGEKDEKNE